MGPAAQPSVPPPVVAVLVTHDAPADRLAEVLASLAAQDHPNLDVLVVETGAGDPSERVRAVLPAARVHRVAGNPGFGAAANVVLDMVSGAEFYLFCHDDAAPEPGAVGAMVAAAQRLHAGVVGPKLVDWADPRRFTQFGLAVDAVGVPLPYVERGERDQGQHDGLCDVFAVPGGFTLVRASTFAEIGGFDEAITFLGDDVSLAWRARVAGARVVVAPAARVRHAEAFTGRPAARRSGRLAARNRLRVVLTTYRLPTLLRIAPLALALSAAEAVGALVTARPGRAVAALAAWPWNLLRLPSLVRARRHVTGFRRVGDRAVRAAQVKGLVGPRLTLLRATAGGRGADGRGGPPGGAALVPVRGRPVIDPATWSPGSALVAAALAATLAFGSRHLLTRFVPVVGGFAPSGGGPGDLVGAWAGGWRPVDLGGAGAPPALAGALGMLATLLGGHAGLARTLLIAGLVPLGVIGAHRLLAPSGSKAGQVAAAVAYAAVPLPYDALAAGRWPALAAYAAAPWMLGRLARAGGAAPYAPQTAPAGGASGAAAGGGDPLVRHRLWRHVLATGGVTGLAALAVPQAPALLVLAGAGLVAGSLLAGEVRGTARVAAAAVGGAAVALLLHAPAAYDTLSSPAGARRWLGAGPGTVGGAGLSDLLLFRTGPTAVAAAGWALVGAAALPLLVARRWRLGWAVRGWTVALAAWALAWAGVRGWAPTPLPETGVLLAPAAAGLALAAGLGVAAIGPDVVARSWRFGARRVAAVLGLAALAASTASPAAASLDGWWGMPRDDFAGLLGFVDREVRAASSLVLWAGEPALLPGGDGRPLEDGLAWTAATDAAVPGVADLWPATARAAPAGAGHAVERALGGRTSRLGRELAELGVQYVVVPLRLAPSADPAGAAGPGGDAAADLVGGLAEQLDLERVRVEPTLAVYRNAAFDPGSPRVTATVERGPASPAPTRALVAAQAAAWLLVFVVALRMRFAPGEPVPVPAGGAPAPPSRAGPAVGDASAGDGEVEPATASGPEPATAGEAARA
ncbi:MAG TPA: glycosyltransferase [Acidimicrobiales bacterium]